MAKALGSEPAPATPGPGHNSGPNEAVFISHLSKLRAQMNKAAAKKAEYDAEKSVLTDLFRVAKADGYSRKELTAILADSAASRRDLMAEEERRAKLRSWAGLPSGTQADLFASTPTLAIDELAAEGMGYSAGLRGDDPKAPDTIGGNHTDAFMRGWHAGQEKLAWALSETGSPTTKTPADGGDILDAIAEAEPEIVDQVLEDHQDEAA